MSTAPPPGFDPTLTYDSYLAIPELLGLQRLRSQPPTHDEMLFIVIHQNFELWFRLMRHELVSLQEVMSDGAIVPAIRRLRRLNEIVHVLDRQIGVLETMSPAEFSKFRDLLKPASGFQSWQFRVIEFTCGAKDERYLKIFESNPELLQKLKAALEGPTLWESFTRLLTFHGYPATSEELQRKTIVRIYREERADMVALCEAMIEYDETFSLWREHHVRMAERMIGSKPGTGEHHVAYSMGQAGVMGTAGVAYLKTTLNKRFFPILWTARSDM